MTLLAFAGGLRSAFTLSAEQMAWLNDRSRDFRAPPPEAARGRQRKFDALGPVQLTVKRRSPWGRDSRPIPLTNSRFENQARMPGHRWATHGNDVGMLQGLLPRKSPKQSKIRRLRRCRGLPGITLERVMGIEPIGQSLYFKSLAFCMMQVRARWEILGCVGRVPAVKSGSLPADSTMLGTQS